MQAIYSEMCQCYIKSARCFAALIYIVDSASAYNICNNNCACGFVFTRTYTIIFLLTYLSFAVVRSRALAWDSRSIAETHPQMVVTIMYIFLLCHEKLILAEVQKYFKMYFLTRSLFYTWFI